MNAQIGYNLSKTKLNLSTNRCVAFQRLIIYLFSSLYMQMIILLIKSETFHAHSILYVVKKVPKYKIG